VSDDDFELPPGRQAVSLSLPQFEGPLDLLLHLCQKHELDILDIPMAFITEKYLEYLNVMQSLDLDLASEYLLMAATLVHIKSKMLLPSPPAGQEDDELEDGLDPREELIRRLLEYQKYKAAAAQILEKPMLGRDVFERGELPDTGESKGLPPLDPPHLYDLMDAFQRVLAKSKVKLSHEIIADRMTLSDRIQEMTDVLREQKRIVFDDLFQGFYTRFDLIISFLAVLEMTKMRLMRIAQVDASGSLHIEWCGGDDEELALAEGEEASQLPPASGIVGAGEG
jgi:segregation and condensation protein A